MKPYGVWAREFRTDNPAEVGQAAAELEKLGYGALWVPGGTGSGLDTAGNILAATTDVTVATGITNIWSIPAREAAERTRALGSAHGGRFLLGLGVSHESMVDRFRPGAYRKPLTAMTSYLDELDKEGVTPDRRVLAALGPKMVDVAKNRAAGAHPYLVTPEQTAAIRSAIGPGRLVATEQGVVLETDPARARQLAREALHPYLAMPNYVNNWLRGGFTDDDVSGRGSDRLIDALFVWGAPEQCAARLNQHRDAGADHVCLQVLGTPAGELPMAQWRELATVLF
ncbi:LLM class F420-dependent oxidoreductase [Herbidospora cretacea]|uniref:LLM class F420-dependent oxidoreductase n=1 Tax=Herbidospora cretacea TaxID=28444 RepID=UPI0004C3522F|nr:LLM class F420-dependent oxidoreductase [Herbidospora cretacea]